LAGLLSTGFENTAEQHMKRPRSRRLSFNGAGARHPVNGFLFILFVLFNLS